MCRFIARVHDCTPVNIWNDLKASFVLNESHGQAPHMNGKKYFIYRKANI